MNKLDALIELGGNSMVAILVLSVILVATILYKLFQFTKVGYWRMHNPTKRDLACAASGLKIMEIASIVAPLLGLLGTVIGMIYAFQALEIAQGTPEIGELASGIWRALSTTAAGMIVAIIATIFLGIFDGVVERMSAELED